MATLPAALAVAIDLHRANRLNEAEQLYQQILAQDPNQPSAWHLLGVVANQRGKHDLAAHYLQQALTLVPDYAEAHCDLGNALQGQNKFPAAIDSYQRALHLKPDYAAAHYNLGNALQKHGLLDQAVAAYRRASELMPDLADPHNNLGLVLREQKKLDEAIASFRRALHLQPDLAEAHCNLGLVFTDQGKSNQAVPCFRRAGELNANYPEAHFHLGNACKELKSWHEAVASYQHAIALKPDYADAHNALGLLLVIQGRLSEAIDCHRRALQFEPHSARLHNNLGAAYQEQGNLDAALLAYRHALELQPDLPESHVNLGNTLKRLGRLNEASASYCRAIELQPDNPHAHLGHSTLQLLQGDFEPGFAQFEWRWKTGQLFSRDFRQPLWNGQPLPGRTILLHAEQGFGDTFQFIRYAPLVKALGASVVFECQKPLQGLLANSPGIDKIVPFGEELPPFDVHAPLLSLPNILKTNLATIPQDIPYLFADPALIQQWKTRLNSIPGFRIGINWRGREGHGEFRHRDIPLSQMAALAKITGVSLISLQRGAGRQELANESHPQPILDLGDDVDVTHGAFTDTAAIMMNLDLVLTSDTSIPHLAGALGVPVWLALPYAPDWRWLLVRPDSPWYPNMRLFRQKTRGDWSAVFNEIQQALRERLESRA